MNTGKRAEKELSSGIFAMEDTKIMIKLCDTNFKKPNDVKHLHKSGS